MLAIERNGGTVFRGVLVELMPPEITATFHRCIRRGPAIDDRVAHAGTFFERLIHGGLELDLFAAAKTAIGGDHQGRAEVLDAGLERLGRESAEHDAMNDAEPRAGEHGDGQLGDHRHVNDGAVAGFVAARLQHAGEADHQAMQFLIGEGSLLAGLAFPENRDFVFARGGQVAVQAVVRDVEFRTGEPAREGRVPFEHFGPLLEPVDLAFGDFTPECFRILFGAAVEVEVTFHALDVGFADEVFAGGINRRGAHRYRIVARRRQATRSPLKISRGRLDLIVNPDKHGIRCAHTLHSLS